MSSSVDDFLKNMGMNKKKEAPQPQSQADKWREIIRPETVSVILGKKGKGKSALAYWLCEDISPRHNLLPVVINLPRERQQLLPTNFVIRGLDDVSKLSDAFIIIDEGTTMLPAGQKKLEELVKGFVALSRQRNQIILFIFHASSDVGSRILRGVDAILLKEPSRRQIQHGSKDNWWRQLLTEAKEKFEALTDLGANGKEYTFVDSEEPDFRGALRNSLPTFWSDDLSKAWAGVDSLANQPDLFGALGKAKTKQSYAHLPPKEILDLCLAFARLDNKEYDKIWNPKYQSFMDKLTKNANEYDLRFVVSDLELKGWIIRRVETGSRCVMVTNQSCPCSNPLTAGCPVLRGTQK